MTALITVTAQPRPGKVIKVAQVRERDHAVVQSKWLREGEGQEFRALDGYTIIVSEVAAEREPTRTGAPAVAVRSPSA